MQKSVLLIAVGLLTVPSVWADEPQGVVEYETNCSLQPIDRPCLMAQATQIYCDAQGFDPCLAQFNLECIQPGGIGGPIALGFRTPIQPNGAFVEIAESLDTSNPTKMYFQRLRFIIDTDGCN